MTTFASPPEIQLRPFFENKEEHKFDITQLRAKAIELKAAGINLLVRKDTLPADDLIAMFQGVSDRAALFNVLQCKGQTFECNSVPEEWVIESVLILITDTITQKLLRQMNNLAQKERHKYTKNGVDYAILEYFFD